MNKRGYVLAAGTRGQTSRVETEIAPTFRHARNRLIELLSAPVGYLAPSTLQDLTDWDGVEPKLFTAPDGFVVGIMVID